MPSILALSGGPDSVYLLHQLLKKGQKPILAHLNHQLRGKESDKDEAFVRELGKKHHLTVEIRRANIIAYAKKHKLSLETAARELRYAFLEKIRQKHHASAILTAHTLDDNLETVLMNELRGAAANGSDQATLRARIGMRDKQGFIERPLLNIRKKTILAALHRDKIPYRVDASNTDLRYRRNWIRHVLIPRLLQKNPHLYKEFAASRQKALREYEKLTRWAEQWLKENSPNQTTDYRLQTTDYRLLSPLRQRFLLQHLYEKIYGSTHSLSRNQLEEVRKLLLEGKTGKQKRFGPKIMIWTEYGKAKIQKNKNRKSVPHRHGGAFGGHTKPPGFPKKSTSPFTLQARPWRPGDRFQPSGMRGTKKLQDYFTDAKIPRSERYKIPVWIIPATKTQLEQIVAVGNRFDEKFAHLPLPQVHYTPDGPSSHSPAKSAQKTPRKTAE